MFFTYRNKKIIGKSSSVGYFYTVYLNGVEIKTTPNWEIAYDLFMKLPASDIKKTTEAKGA